MPRAGPDAPPSKPAALKRLLCRPGALPTVRSYVALNGFSADAPYSAGADCWQQLAVVKSGPTLTWYYNKEAAGGTRNGGVLAAGWVGLGLRKERRRQLGVWESSGPCWPPCSARWPSAPPACIATSLAAGTASAPFVVNDYGTTGIAIGVDYASAGASNSTAIDPSQADLGWFNANIAMLAVYSRSLDAAAIAAIYDEQQAANRYSEALCTRVGGRGRGCAAGCAAPGRTQAELGVPCCAPARKEDQNNEMARRRWSHASAAPPTASKEKPDDALCTMLLAKPMS